MSGTAEINIRPAAPGGALLIFELRNPQKLQQELFEEIKRDYSPSRGNTCMVFSEQRMIDAFKIYIEGASLMQQRQQQRY
jgi:hypothetical protein